MGVCFNKCHTGYQVNGEYIVSDKENGDQGINMFYNRMWEINF